MSTLVSSEYSVSYSHGFRFLPVLKTCLGEQEKRVIEYVALGDFATAVGFLLASTPEKSARYYRDALCTLALAV